MVFHFSRSLNVRYDCNKRCLRYVSIMLPHTIFLYCTMMKYRRYFCSNFGQKSDADAEKREEHRENVGFEPVRRQNMVYSLVPNVMRVRAKTLQRSSHCRQFRTCRACVVLRGATHPEEYTYATAPFTQKQRKLSSPTTERFFDWSLGTMHSHNETHRCRDEVRRQHHLYHHQQHK